MLRQWAATRPTLSAKAGRPNVNRRLVPNNCRGMRESMPGMFLTSEIALVKIKPSRRRGRVMPETPLSQPKIEIRGPHSRSGKHRRVAPEGDLSASIVAFGTKTRSKGQVVPEESASPSSNY